MTRSAALATTLLCLFAAACAEAPLLDPGLAEGALPGEPVTLTRVEPGPSPHSGFSEPARIVVTSQAQWEAVWRKITGSATPATPPPAVDFRREVVLVAAMGGRHTGGYTVRVEEAAADARQVSVRIVETSPSARCVVTQAFTAPVDVVKMTRTSLPVRFGVAQQVRDCT